MALRATRPSGAATGRVPPSVAVSASCAGADAVLTDAVGKPAVLPDPLHRAVEHGCVRLLRVAPVADSRVPIDDAADGANGAAHPRSAVLSADGP